MQVLGNAKGVVAATISVLLFHNPVTAMSMTGYGITVCGVVCYSQARLWFWRVQGAPKPVRHPGRVCASNAFASPNIRP